MRRVAQEWAEKMCLITPEVPLSGRGSGKLMWRSLSAPCRLRKEHLSALKGEDWKAGRDF